MKEINEAVERVVDQLTSIQSIFQQMDMQGLLIVQKIIEAEINLRTGIKAS